MLGVSNLLRLARRLPGLYPVLAFILARRIAVRGPSMYPALRPGERVLFDRLAYRLDEPKVGDVVLARHPARPGVRFIKRVAAVPIAASPQHLGVQAEYWLLGDNPDRSTDSRELGGFLREDIVARGWLVYWPPERVRWIHRP